MVHKQLGGGCTMDRLYFFSRSADRLPGSGANERVTDPQQYTELEAVPNWRQMLSNFWVAPIQTAYEFTLDSGSELGRSGGEAARRNRKAVILTPGQLAQWDRMKDEVVYVGLLAKFSQHPELHRVLLATKKAELWHGTPRTPAARQFLLEKVRDLLAFEDLAALLQSGSVSSVEITSISPRDPQNVVARFVDVFGKDRLVELKWNLTTNEIFPPN